MKKVILLYISILVIPFIVNAQENLTISGFVANVEGETLPGVTITVKGKALFAETDMNGGFTLKGLSKDDVLEVSYVGYKTQAVVVTKTESNLKITLNQSWLELSEVVVTGYSKQERRDITGSVATVRPADIITGGQSIDQLLQGQAAGVYMTTSSGALGAANQMTIRGISSIIGDNNPLYVVDGIPIYGTSRAENLTSTSGGSIPAVSMGGVSVSSSIANNHVLKYSFEKNPLASLNPEDIESIEILKDAFATAIYGSRGSAGVILITTKKGYTEKTKVNVNCSYQFGNPVEKLNLLDGKEYNLVYSMYYPNTPFLEENNTDWLDAVTRTSSSYNFSTSVSGGTNNTHYFISALYNKTNSYIINNDMNRYAARINLDSRLNQYFTIGTNLTISQLNNNAIAAPTIFALAAKKAPNLPIYRENSDKYFYGKGTNPYGNPEVYNPVAMAYNNDEGIKDTRLTGNIYVEVKPTKWLTWRTNFGTDIYDTESSVRKADVPLTEVTSKDQAHETVNMNRRYVINNTLNLTKEWGKHFVQGVVGQSYEYSKQYMNSIRGAGFFSSSLKGVGAAQNKSVVASGKVEYALFSAFTRLNYQYKRKYMLGVTYRLDGSSRYDRDNRFLSTPSFSLGWRLGNERFIKDNLKWIDELKLRSSVGWSSRDANYGYYGAQAIYSLVKGTSFSGKSYLEMSQPGNSNLDWEKTITYDIGLDATILNRRVDFNLDYYYKKTTDMLFPSDLPAYTGYSKQEQNIGDMENQGFEMRLTSRNITEGNLQWLTTLTISRNTNKILKLDFEGNQLDQLNSSYKYYAVGYPAAQFYLYKWEGIDKETGNPLWRYKDGTLSTTPPQVNSKEASENKFISGAATPDFYGGFSNTLLYKGIELSCMFTFSHGGKMINNTKAQLLTYSTSDANNLDKDILKYWQMQGHYTGMPKLRNNSVVGSYDYTTSSTTTRFLEDNSYLRLKTLELSYSLPQSLLRKSKLFNQVKFYIVGTNLLTFTKYSGLDPEVNAFGSSATASGYDNLTMPQERAFQFGVKVGF